MEKRLKALEQAMQGRNLQTRTNAEIEADLEEVIGWAETEGRNLPVRIKAGRPIPDS